MAEQEPEKICINLTESSDAKVYESKDIIHLLEYNRIRTIIEMQIERAKSLYEDNSDNEKRFRRYNDTISILGSRGSGKTSFILSLLNSYKRNKDVAVLKLVDPTLIEQKGHVFLTIISLIKDMVEHHFDFNGTSPSEPAYEIRKIWENKLRKLACGLPSIDGVGEYPAFQDWQDSEYIMDKGLKSVQSAFDLEHNFNDLVGFALKILEKKVFILALDDIDVDFLKGWPVLETIRKYLTSPQLIVLLSGDLKLYAKAIRKQQWKNFGKALLINEYQLLHKREVYNDLVTEMESQYMQKVIKPKNRIYLTTLLEKTLIYKSLIEISVKQKQKDGATSSPEIKKYYNQILQSFGIKNAYQADAYATFLLSQPLRTQIQFMTAYESAEGGRKDESEAFLNELYENEVDVDLARNVPYMLNVVILKLLLKEKTLHESYQLQPTTSDTNLNSCLIALTIVFSKQVKNNPYLIFDYWVRICLVRNILSDVGYKADKKNEAPFSIEDLCENAGAFQDLVLRNIAGNIIGYIRGVLNYSKEKTGKKYMSTIPLMALDSDDETRLNGAFKNDSPDNQILAFFPACKVSDFSKNRTTLIYSPMLLLATIGEILKEYQITKNITECVTALSQIRTYLMPRFKDSATQAEEDQNDDEIEDEGPSEGEAELETHLITWIKAYPKDMALSPHLLGKISTRYLYAINDIEKNIYETIGECMYRQLVAILNAILVEEIKENASIKNNNEANTDFPSKLTLNNPITSSLNFIKNLKFATQYKAELPLSKWMLSCPLFIMYLEDEEDDDDLMNLYIDFIKSDEKDETYFVYLFIHSIYYTLNTVYTRDEETSKPSLSATNEADRKLLIECFISNNIPYSLFTKNNLSSTERNKVIRERCLPLVRNKKINPDYINKFIDYLKTCTDKNVDLIEKWKQAQ